MLAAIEAPSTSLRATEVIFIRFSPYANFQDFKRGLWAAECSEASARTGKVEDRPCLGLAGAGRRSFWTERRCFVRDACCTLLQLQRRFIAGLQHCSYSISLHCPSSDFDDRRQEIALDRYAAAGPRRAAALHALCGIVRAFFQPRRARSSLRPAVPRSDELHPHRHDLAR